MEKENGLTRKEEEQLSCDRTLKARFRQESQTNFSACLLNEYAEVAAEAMQILFPFPATYLCESSFPPITVIKNKYRARLQVETDRRVFFSFIKLFKLFCFLPIV